MKNGSFFSRAENFNCTFEQNSRTVSTVTLNQFDRFIIKGTLATFRGKRLRMSLDAGLAVERFALLYGAFKVILQPQGWLAPAVMLCPSARHWHDRHSHA